MDFTVVFNFFIAVDLDHFAIVESEAVCGVFKILFLDQHTLEYFRVEAECGAALESFFVGIHVDVFEIFKRKICRNVSRFGD